ncbi:MULTISPECIES: AtpZ/AtpI family protein [Bizionia]|nr:MULTISPECIES: AtpZ/AtpI family protein [Bizionia]
MSAKKPQNKKPNKPLNKYIRFTTIAIQMGLIIYLGSLLGTWLDVKFENPDQLYYKIITLISVAVAMFSVIYQVIKITNKNSDD